MWFRNFLWATGTVYFTNAAPEPEPRKNKRAKLIFLTIFFLQITAVYIIALVRNRKYIEPKKKVFLFFNEQTYSQIEKKRRKNIRKIISLFHTDPIPVPHPVFSTLNMTNQVVYYDCISIWNCFALNWQPIHSVYTYKFCKLSFHFRQFEN